MTDIPTIAPLKNVLLFHEMVGRACEQPDHLPSLALFHGPSGLGKTLSATYSANKHRAYYVEVGAFWSVSKFCDALLRETGPILKGTIADKIEVIIERLAMSNRPLIIDEFDHMAADQSGKRVELVRDLHDKSGAAIIMIGEELLPDKLKKWERFHNRISQWVGAEPSTLSDAAKLAEFYCPDIEIAKDVLEELTAQSGHTARRICINLENIKQSAKSKGLKTYTLSDVDFRWSTGIAPKGRRF